MFYPITSTNCHMFVMHITKVNFRLKIPLLFQVCITDILQEEGQKTASELQSKYGQERVTFIHCDVTKESELKGNQYSVA